MRYILAVDQSTSATKAILFDTAGTLIDKTSLPHQQIYPQPGWVEHDAEEIYANTVRVLREVVENNRDKAGNLLCLSITNQRETFVVFDKKTGRPLHNAIVWQCRRGDPICNELVEAGHGERIRKATGLKIDSYFPAPKLKWLLDNRDDIRRAVESGRALIGTIDAYLVYRLTGGEVFATDHTNASRTLLFDIEKLQWDTDLCGLFGTPVDALPEVRESAAEFGRTNIEGLLSGQLPICGIMGDSQAALFAQRCFTPGSAKVTFGTGSSILVNIGRKMQLSESGLVTTIAWVYDGQTTYAFEGLINCTGATIAWLKDQLEMIGDPAESEPLAQAVDDNAGVYLVPAFAGLSAPYWSQDAKGALLGLTQHSTRNHVVRAALESIAYQVKDVLDVVVKDAAIPLNVVHGDGGMVANRFLMQFVADMAGMPVKASALAELSALGAVLSGALGMDEYGSLEDLAKLDFGSVEYRPAMDKATVEAHYAGWKQAVRRVL